MKSRKKTKESIRKSAPAIQEQKNVAASLINQINHSHPKEIVRLLPDADTAALFIELLPLRDSSALPMLAALKEVFKEKQVRKAMKRALFKLKSEGISTDGFFEEEKGDPALRPLPKEEPQCFVGPVDGFGYRAVALVLPRTRQAADVAFAVVSDEMGFAEMDMGTTGRKKATQWLQEFKEAAGPMVETSLSHAATILEKAYKVSQSGKAEASHAYSQLRPWLLENCTLLDHAAVFDYLPASSVQELPLTNDEIDHLLKESVMLSWIIDYGRLKPFLEETAAIHASPIILTEAQKERRALEIREKCSRTIFPPEKSGLLKRRLEEMACFFLKQNDEKNAFTCLKSSMNLPDRDSLFRKSPFIERLVFTSMEIFRTAGSKQ